MQYHVCVAGHDVYQLAGGRFALRRGSEDQGLAVDGFRGHGLDVDTDVGEFHLAGGCDQRVDHWNDE